MTDMPADPSMPSVRRSVTALLALALCASSSLVFAQNKEPHPGQAPFDRVCKVCHGEEGKGNAGPRLVPFEMDADDLLIRVREGGGEMPPISANRVSDDEVKQIAAYLKALTAAQEPAGATQSLFGVEADRHEATVAAKATTEASAAMPARERMKRACNGINERGQP